MYKNKKKTFSKFRIFTKIILIYLTVSISFKFYNNRFKLPVYLDNQATTQIDPRVAKKMQYIFKNYFGNPSSLHKIGQDARKIVEESRNDVAKVINADPDEIIFTSGATESNNLIIKGLMEKFIKNKEKKHIISTTIEHSCVKNSLAKMESEGIEVTYLIPRKDGIIDINELENAIQKNTVLISIIGVNNEIGVIQDLEKIAEIAKKNNILLHTDYAQGFGKVPIDVKKIGIDFVSISGHKIYAPKGIGAVYIKNEKKKLISPILHGGGQEQGIRSGTIPLEIIAGFGEAAKIIKNQMDSDNARIEKLSNRLKEGILKIDGAILNGNPEKRYKGCMNFSFRGIKGRQITDPLKDKVALSIGSACGSSKDAFDSYVIKSIQTDFNFTGGIRFGIGRFTTEKEIDYAIKEVTELVNKIRRNA